MDSERFALLHYPAARDLAKKWAKDRLCPSCALRFVAHLMLVRLGQADGTEIVTETAPDPPARCIHWDEEHDERWQVPVVRDEDMRRRLREFSRRIDLNPTLILRWAAIHDIHAP